MLNHNKQAEFLNAINIGATREIACGLVGVSYASFKKWSLTLEGQEFTSKIIQSEKGAASRWAKRVDMAASKGRKGAKSWLNAHIRRGG